MGVHEQSPLTAAGHDRDPRRPDRPHPGVEPVPTAAERLRASAAADQEVSLGGRASWNTTATAGRMQTRASTAHRHGVIDVVGGGGEPVTLR